MLFFCILSLDVKLSRVSRAVHFLVRSFGCALFYFTEVLLRNILKGRGEKMFCANCGRQLSADAVFCDRCGQQSGTVAVTAPVVNRASSSRRGVGTKSVVVAIVAVLLVAVAFLIFHQSDEEKILSLAGTLEESLNEGDFEKMIGCFEPSVQNEVRVMMDTASALIGSVDLKDLWTIGSTEMSHNDSIMVNVYRIEVDGETAVADIGIEYGSREDREDIELVKIKGKWYFKDDFSLF